MHADPVIATGIRIVPTNLDTLIGKNNGRAGDKGRRKIDV